MKVAKEDWRMGTNDQDTALNVPASRHYLFIARSATVVAFALLTMSYLLVTALTGAHFMADTRAYVGSILEYHHGGHMFWDFGHLFWRPLGWLIFVLISPLTTLFLRGNERVQATVTLIVVSRAAGLVCVLALFHLTRRILGRIWVGLFAALALLFADAFLNFVHAGSPYVPGLACLILGTWLLMRNTASSEVFWRISFPAALLFALSVFFWFPFAFVIPAAMSMPLFIVGVDSRRARIVSQALAACLSIGLLTYAIVIAGIGIRNYAGLKDWIISAGHGQLELRGLVRLAFALPRSFVNMGHDGVYFKRYLLHDPYAPVTFSTLLKLGAWKIVLFYLLIGGLCLELLRSRPGRRMLLWMLLGCVPILTFALFIFETGSIERYLPLYLFVLFAMAHNLGEKHSSHLSKIVILSWFVLMALVNVSAMERRALCTERERVADRIRGLQPFLKSATVVMTIDVTEDVSQFKMNFLLDPINTEIDWQNYDVLEVSAARLVKWREDFADRVLSTWSRGGDVWLSKRFFSAVPRPQWNWVEGEDQRIAWKDLPTFFSQYETGYSVGTDDGFLLLVNSPKNRKILFKLANNSTAQELLMSTPP